MGAELQKQSGRYDPKSSRASASADGCALPLSSVSNGDRSNAVDEARRLAQGHAWMHTEAELLFVDGMFKACQQVLDGGSPVLPEGPLAAALVRAISKANRAICRHSTFCLEDGREKHGSEPRQQQQQLHVGAGVVGDATDTQAREDAIAALEASLQDVITVALSAAAATVAWTPPPAATKDTVPPEAHGTSSITSSGSGGGGGGRTGARPSGRGKAGNAAVAPDSAARSRRKEAAVDDDDGGDGVAGGEAAAPPAPRQAEELLMPAVIAAAAEDVAVQIACAALTARMNSGEPSKALAVGLRLMSTPRGVDTDTPSVGADGSCRDPGGTTYKVKGKTNGTDERPQQEGDRRAGEAGRADERAWFGRALSRDEEAARDALSGVDALRDAFGRALEGSSGGGGRNRLSVQDAAPRLLHLVRFSWLMAVANLALGRPAAAARLLSVAEHAYGARRSAWRKATLLLASSPRGGSSPFQQNFRAHTQQAPVLAGFQRGHGGGGVAEGKEVSLSMGLAGSTRDPALAMCRFLRGLAVLRGGEVAAAAALMEESLELDPTSRHAIVCLAHISCFTSALSWGKDRGPTNASQSESPPSPAGRRTVKVVCASRRWEPPDGRTRELLRILEIGVSARDGGIGGERSGEGSGQGVVFDEHGRGTREWRSPRWMRGGQNGDVQARRCGGVGGWGDDGGMRESDEGWRAFAEEKGGGVEAWVLLGCVARAAGDAGGAVSMFRKALGLDPHCLEAVYGVARVLQEAGDNTASRDLLLYLGERSQELLAGWSQGRTSRQDPSVPAADGTAAAADSANHSGAGGGRNKENTSTTSNAASARPNRRARLCFPLDDSSSGVLCNGARAVGGVFYPACGRLNGGVLESAGGGVGGSSVRGHGGIGGAISAAPMPADEFLWLPTALEEVMWRVARASMGERDWDTAILALKGLAAAAGPARGSGGGDTGAGMGRPEQWGGWYTREPYYFASFTPGDDQPRSSGPGRARVLRALAVCQLQRGLYREALETTEVVLRWHGDSTSAVPRGGAAAGAGTMDDGVGVTDEGDRREYMGVDAAMLMLRADALLCLEEREHVALRSLEAAAQLLNRRPIDMSQPAKQCWTGVYGAGSTRMSSVFGGQRDFRGRSMRRSAESTARSASSAQHSSASRSVQPPQSTSTTTATTATPHLKAPRTGGSNNNPTAKRPRNTNNKIMDGDNESERSGLAPDVTCMGTSASKKARVGTKTGDSHRAHEHEDGHDDPQSPSSVVDGHRRIARVAAFNNRAVLLIAAGRGLEACALLRSCLLMLPGEPRPAFNLVLALWRLGRPRAACAQWMSFRGWVCGGGGGEADADVETITRLLESARRRKALVESEAERKRSQGSEGWRSDTPPSSCHVTEGPPDDPLSVPQSQVCLLDIRTLRWWLDNAVDDAQHRERRERQQQQQRQQGGGSSLHGTPGALAPTGLLSMFKDRTKET